MRLAKIRLKNVGVFSDLLLEIGDEGSERGLTVLFGADGIGKTTLLSAIAHTRPGHALPIPRLHHPNMNESAVPSITMAEWNLSDDDTERPHPLVVASPMAILDGETETQTTLRRREQALFDKRAHESGYAFVAFSGARWFSRTHVTLVSPERSIARYDARAPVSFDDATRADLTRETKQVLAYAAIGRALEMRTGAMRLTRFDDSLREILAVLLEPFDVKYEGADPTTLEPMFESDAGSISFDELPKGARHLVAIGSLTARALFGAYQNDTSPRLRQGVALVDDIESQQDASLLSFLPRLLASALPRVQWILTTASASIPMGCEAGEVLALRRTGNRVEVHQGALATLH